MIIIVVQYLLISKMADAIAGAQQLISDQIAIIFRLQNAVSLALDRSDSQSAQRWVETLDQAFGTFLQGIEKMAIDVSSLKNVLTAASAQQEAVQTLTQKVAKIEEQLKTSDPAAIAQVQSDISEIKAALSELNSSVNTPAV